MIRTVVDVAGTSATNGSSDSISATYPDKSVAAASEVTCGNLTLDNDGVSATSDDS